MGLQEKGTGVLLTLTFLHFPTFLPEKDCPVPQACSGGYGFPARGGCKGVVQGVITQNSTGSVLGVSAV